MRTKDKIQREILPIPTSLMSILTTYDIEKPETKEARITPPGARQPD